MKRFFAFTDSDVSTLANCTHVLSADDNAGSIVRDGFTFSTGNMGGFHSDGAAQYYDGYHYQNDGLGSPMTFSLDLTAFGGPGTYKIGLGLGATNSSQLRQYAKIKDGATLLHTTDAASVAAGHLVDVSGADFTDAAWAAGQAFATVTVAGSTLSFEFGNTGASDGYTCCTCIYVEKVVSGPTIKKGFYYAQTQGLN